jgi:hypothetical protein
VTGAGDPVRWVIEHAVLVPPAIIPLESDVRQPAPPAIVARLPVRMLGIAEAPAGETIERYGIGTSLFVYGDSRGRRRFLLAEQHDRAGIASLFLFNEAGLGRLWPSPRRRTDWDADHAAEQLIGWQGMVGICRPHRGEIVVPEPPGAARSLIRLGRRAWSTLQLQTDPYVALALVRAWSAARLAPPLPDAEIVATVNHLCGILLRRRNAVAHG